MFGSIDAQSDNRGDEIQAIAARAFLPRVDRVVAREALHLDPGQPTAVIMNGWFMSRPDHWPPHPNIRPLPISMHLASLKSRRRFWRPTPAQRMLSPAGIEWLRKHGPIGARDEATRALLAGRGIESYHSSCLTLTLPQRPSAAAHGRIVACDLDESLVAALQARSGEAPLQVSHLDPQKAPLDDRLRVAETLLDLYAGASAVVTTRLHCALPCLALGTPVLFIPQRQDRARLEPGISLAHWCEAGAFLSGRYDWDPRRPPPNPESHVPLAASLAERVVEFVAAHSR